MPNTSTTHPLLSSIIHFMSYYLSWINYILFLSLILHLSLFIFCLNCPCFLLSLLSFHCFSLGYGLLYGLEVDFFKKVKESKLLWHRIWCVNSYTIRFVYFDQAVPLSIISIKFSNRCFLVSLYHPLLCLFPFGCALLLDVMRRLWTFANFWIEFCGWSQFQCAGWLDFKCSSAASILLTHSYFVRSF